MARPTRPTPWVVFAVDGVSPWVSMWVGFNVHCGWVSPWIGFRCGWVSTCAVGGFSPWMGFRRGWGFDVGGFRRVLWVGFRHGWGFAMDFTVGFAIGGFRRALWVGFVVGDAVGGSRRITAGETQASRPTCSPDPWPASICWVCFFL
jgi:hypothetical protein